MDLPYTRYPDPLHQSRMIGYFWADSRSKRRYVMSQSPLTLTRQSLYELVWTTPMSSLAHDFGISDVALASRGAKRRDNALLRAALSKAKGVASDNVRANITYWRLPEVKYPAEDAGDKPRRTRQSEIEPEPFLESIPAYRYVHR
jgi:hypothetical protein